MNKINTLTNHPYKETDKVCPKCNNILYDTDVEGYEYVCLECDENFYECEVIE
jgi:acetyl-CoA carboxylase beta subunit